MPLGRPATSPGMKRLNKLSPKRAVLWLSSTVLPLWLSKAKGLPFGLLQICAFFCWHLDGSELLKEQNQAKSGGIEFLVGTRR